MESINWTFAVTYQFENISNNSSMRAVSGEPSVWIAMLGLVVAITTSLVGALANSITIAAFRRNRKLQTSFNRLITNLCAVDLIFSILVLPFNIPLILTKREIYPVELCSTIGYIYASSTSSSVINLVFIAVNRYIGVVHSSRYTSAFSNEHLKWWNITVWIITPIFYLPFVISASFSWNQSVLSCALSSRDSSKPIKIYHIIINVMLHLIPTIMLVLFYRAILSKVKKCRKTVEEYPSPMPRSREVAETRNRSLRGSWQPSRTQSLEKSNQGNKVPLFNPSDSKSVGTVVYLQVPASKPATLEDTSKSDLSLESLIEPPAPFLSDGYVPNHFQSQNIPHPSPKLYDENQTHFVITPCLNDLTNDKKINKTKPHKPLVSSDQSKKQEITTQQGKQMISNTYSEPNSPTNFAFHTREKENTKEVLELKPCEKKLNSETEYLDITQETVDLIIQNRPQSVVEKRDSPFPVTLKEEVKTMLTLPVWNRLTTSNSQTRLCHQPHAIQNSSQLAEQEKTLHQHETKNFESITQDGNTTTHNPKFVRSSLSKLKTPKIFDIQEVKPNLSNLLLEKEEKHMKKTPIVQQHNRKQRTSSRKLSQHFKKKRPILNDRNGDSQSPKLSGKRKKQTPNVKIVIEQATSEDSPDDNDSRLDTKNKQNSLNIKSHLTGLKEIKSHVKKKTAKPFGNASATAKHKPHSLTKSKCCRSIINKMFSRRVSLTSSNSTDLKSRDLDCQEKVTSNDEQSYKVISLTHIEKDQRQDIRDRIRSNRLASNYIMRLQDDHKLKNPNLKTLKVCLNKNGSAMCDTFPNPKDIIINEECASPSTGHARRYSVVADEGLSGQGLYYCTNEYTHTRKRNNDRLLSRNTDIGSPGRINRRGSLFNWSPKKSFNSSLAFSSVSSYGHRRRRKNRRAVEKHLAFSGSMICIAFSICVLPSIVIDILNNQSHIEVAPDVQFTIVMLSWVHVIVNPLLYGFLNPQYRLEFRRIQRDVGGWWKLSCGQDIPNDLGSQISLATSGWNSKSRFPSWMEGSERKP